MKRIALLSIMMLIALCSQAQLYSSEACFYIKAGEVPRVDDYDYNSWIIVKFRGNKAIGYDGPNNCRLYFIRDNLKKNQNYYEENNGGMEFTFDSSLSTSSKYVYTRYKAEWYTKLSWGSVKHPAENEIFEFNKDLSTLTRYYKKGDSDYSTYYYVRVPKSEVLPVSDRFIE